MNNRFKEARKDRNLTQDEVAQKLSITRQAYGRYENGERECSFDTLRKLSKIFSTSIDYLLCNEVNNTAPITAQA